MYRTLMVPLDGSPFGEHALPLALTIARRAGAGVNLVQVSVPDSPRDRAHRLHHADDDISLQALGRLYLDQLAASLSARWDVPITTTVLEGQVAPTLKAHALSTSADLVVMTTHGRGALARVALGSIADSLVRSLPLPLLLVRPRDGALDLLESIHEDACQRVLLPLDGSPLAEAVLEPAVALGELFAAEFTLLQAIAPPLLGYALTAHAAGIDQHTLDVLRESAHAYLSRIAQRLRERKLRVTTEVALGYPALAIVERAREGGCDLVALATHGRGGLARVLLGSTADAVVSRSAAPLLVIRPRAAIVGRDESDPTEAIEQIVA